MDDLTDPATAWGAVAAAWDEYGDQEDVVAAATPLLLERLQVQPGDQVLELGAGPGTLGATWSALAGPSGHVVVSDLAPPMVEVARRRNAAHANVDVQVLDASAIDAPASSFDVVACRMGLMFTPDPAAAFAEVHRVLDAGGRFGSLTWGPIERNPWMTCLGMAAMVHGLVTGGPPVGPGGIFSLSDPARVEALAVEAGFQEVVVEEVPVTFRAATVDEHLDRVSSLAGPLAVVLAQATPEQREAVRATARDLAAPHVTADGVELPGLALALTGRR